MPAPVRALAPVAVVILLAGCSAATRWEAPPPVPGRPAIVRPTPGPRPAEHVVAPGETLFGLARRYGVAVGDLARWNSLGADALIRPGQRLRLAGPVVPPGPARAAAPPPAWRWPVAGPVRAPFGSDPAAATGVLLGGTVGDSVRAAADGVVVYAGNSLPGYGELLIVKHNDSWLSAYGHNAALLVGEGARVTAGEPIARLGLGPGRQPLLHFEVRRNGEPVDPLSFLPRR